MYDDDDDDGDGDEKVNKTTNNKIMFGDIRIYVNVLK